LERSQISTVEVLGFINELVEISQVKVILVANEKVLIEGDDKGIYKEFKEKVIGKTFEIKHDFSSVLCDFLDGSSLSEYKEII
ncbi:P-loop NTPase fold protein, partial [Vibrio harveyi]